MNSLYFFFIIIFVPTRLNNHSFTAWFILNYASEKPNRASKKRNTRCSKFCLEIIKEQLSFAELNSTNIDLALLSLLVHKLQCSRFPENSVNVHPYTQKGLLSLLSKNYSELYAKINVFPEKGIFVFKDNTFFFQTSSGMKADFVVQVPLGVYTHKIEDSFNSEEVKSSNNRFYALAHKLGALFPSLKILRVLIKFAECELIVQAKNKPSQKSSKTKDKGINTTDLKENLQSEGGQKDITKTNNTLNIHIENNINNNIEF